MRFRPKGNRGHLPSMQRRDGKKMMPLRWLQGYPSFIWGRHRRKRGGGGCTLCRARKTPSPPKKEKTTAKNRLSLPEVNCAHHHQGHLKMNTNWAMGNGKKAVYCFSGREKSPVRQTEGRNFQLLPSMSTSEEPAKNLSSKNAKSSSRTQEKKKKAPKIEKETTSGKSPILFYLCKG